MVKFYKEVAKFQKIQKKTEYSRFWDQLIAADKKKSKMYIPLGTAALACNSTRESEAGKTEFKVAQ